MTTLRHISSLQPKMDKYQGYTFIGFNQEVAWSIENDYISKYSSIYIYRKS